MNRLLVLCALTAALSASAADRPAVVEARSGESLAAVRDRVRSLPEEARRRGVEVVLAPGDYILSEALQLGEGDGGASAESPVKWRGEKGARIVGGARVAASRFRPVEDAAVSGENTMGFYFDDCDCGDEVFGNTFRDVARGIMIGGGRDHPVVSNTFVRCNIGLSIDCRGMTWRQWNTPGGGWNLEEKASRLGYTNGVWAARYPRLARIMDDHPREPLYNPVTGNIFVDCREVLRLGKEAPMERMSPISGNTVARTAASGAPPAKIDPRVAAGFTVVDGQKGR